MSKVKNTQILKEMHPNDVHFKRIMNYYDKGTPSTKKQVAIVVTGNKNANRSNIMDDLGDMDYHEILDIEKLLKFQYEGIALNEGLGTAISKIRNLAIKVASQKVDSAKNHLKIDKIQKDKPNGKEAMMKAQMALSSQGNLDEDLKSIINKLAVKIGTGATYGAMISGLVSAGSWFSYLDSTFTKFYYAEIQKLAEPEVFRIMQDAYGAQAAEGSLWGKFGMYAFFIFFVIAVISLAVARLSKQKNNEDAIPGGLAKGMDLTDVANHHKVDIDELMKEFELGVKTEMEHTSDRKVAEEIALDHLFEDPKYYTKLTAMEKGDLKAEASNPAERIQKLNNRIAKLRADMARAKTDSQKNIFQARMKNALQTLSNIRKDLGTKKESISESVLVYKINQPAVEKFLKKYPRVNQIMKTLVTKNKDVMKGYKAFLKLKDSNEDYLGGRAEVSSSPTFGTKTFYKYDWNGVGGWAELYQYLYNQQNESVNEAVSFKDGKYHFYSKNGMAYLTYGGKELSSGDWDGDADAYFMSHSSWKGQKAFDDGKAVIGHFKKNNIITESSTNRKSVNEENEPTNPELWDRAIAAAKAKYDVYPSAYTNAFASKWYKEKGGDWKTKKESVNEAGPCWKGYKQVGMKDKSGKQVPNCVPESLDLNESHFSEIDLMAKDAKTFRDFVKEFYKEYPKLPKDKESMKWLEGLYKSVSEGTESDELERVADALPQTVEEMINEISLSSAGVKDFLRALYRNNTILKKLGFANFKGVVDYIKSNGSNDWYELRDEATGFGLKFESVNEDCGCNKNTLTEGVAKEILAQLGGNKFVAMTGAKNLVDGGKFLAFKLPRAKDGINYVKITLTSMDLYDIEFGKIRANQYNVVKKVDGIYNDQLQNIFTKVTGLYTRL